MLGIIGLNGLLKLLLKMSNLTSEGRPHTSFSHTINDKVSHKNIFDAFIFKIPNVGWAGMVQLTFFHFHRGLSQY